MPTRAAYLPYGGGVSSGGGGSDIADLDESTDDVALNDAVAVLDTSAGDSVRVPIENFAAYVKPDSTGHAPVIDDDDLADMIIDNEIPCLLDGVALYLRKELHGGHGASASWLYYKSLPDVSDVGDVDAPAWARSVTYAVGDVVNAAGGTISVCVQAHTATASGATGNPDDENVGFEAYWTNRSSPTSFENLISNFGGVVERSSEVTTPVDGEWIYVVNNTLVYGEIYRTSGTTGWYNYSPPNVHNMLGYYVRESDVLDDVPFYSDSQHVFAVIGQRLAILVAYTAPAAADHTYQWRRRDNSGRPQIHGEDSSIAGSADQAIVTDIDMPTSQWAWVNFGDIGSDRQGAWTRFLVSDLETLTEVSAGTAPSDANALMFFGDQAHKLYLMHTAAGKIAVACNNASKLPGAVRVRID